LICSSPSIVPPDIIPPVPPPVPPDPLVEIVSDDDDVPDPATVDDNNNTVPPPVDPAEVEYDSLNAVDFTDECFAWSNPSTSTDVQHLPDADPTMGPYDSVVKVTLHQLQICTNHDDVEPLRVPAAPVRHVNGLCR